MLDPSRGIHAFYDSGYTYSDDALHIVKVKTITNYQTTDTLPTDSYRILTWLHFFVLAGFLHISS